MDSWHKKIKTEVRGDILTDERLSDHTTIKIGGPACLWFEPADVDDLRTVVVLAKVHKIPIKIIGAGSNVLFSDKGYRGIIVYLRSQAFKNITIEGTTVRAGAGVRLSELISKTTALELSGMEFLSGIPGTVGGAVITNAGVRVPETGKYADMAELIEEVTIVDDHGVLWTLGKDDLVFSYRWSNLCGYIILEACLKLSRKSVDQIKDTEQKLKEYRRVTQPLDALSSGCIFRNPSSDLSSGKLIDLCGLKGKQIGQAQISNKHANFIINLGQADFGNVLDLINLVQEKVCERFDIKLEPEVEIIDDVEDN